ncbi:MAG: alpha/beta fold hydrolase [Candidatus Thorarchaeota archaeon]
MDRRLHYYTLLILTILIASSLYLSWATDRGLGTLDVDRIGIETQPGRTVNFTVYSPKDRLARLMPVVITIHGVGGSKEAMYGFNIELARQYITVASVDLAGHGDSSMPFDIEDYAGLAEDCYAVLQYVGLHYNDTDPTLYGVVAHSLGFHVGLAMYDMPVQPKALVAIGPVWMETVQSLPGNLLLAVGEFDELVQEEDLLETLRSLTGIPTAMSGVTYGGFDGDAAYRLVIAPTNHVSEAIDSLIVVESVSWMLQALHNVEEPDLEGLFIQLIYENRTIANTIGAAALLLSIIPLLFIVVTHLPEQIRPERIGNETETLSLSRIGLLSGVLGAVFVALYALSGVAGFNLETAGINWPNSMLATGLVLFFVVCPIIWLLAMALIIGRRVVYQTILSMGYEHGNVKGLAMAVSKGILVGLICIGWLLFWAALGGMPGAQNSITILPIFRFPNLQRFLNTLAVTCLALPFSIVDAQFTRGLMLAQRDWGGRVPYARRIVTVFGLRVVPVTAFSVVLVLGTTALGFVLAPVVLLGLLLSHFVLISAFVVLLNIFSSVEFGNPWPAIVIGAFLYAWFLIGTVPLI